MRTVIARGTQLDPEPKLDHYRRSLDMLEETIPENRLVKVLRFELEALEELPPRSAPEELR